MTRSKVDLHNAYSILSRICFVNYFQWTPFERGPDIRNCIVLNIILSVLDAVIIFVLLILILSEYSLKILFMVSSK